ncbi:MAG: hydrogenase iron-sulfur subunit [Desulfobaccales bacterium]
MSADRPRHPSPADKPRIGLYICHCGLNIAGVISPVELARRGQELPEVVVCRNQLYACSEAGQREIAQDIAELGLSRVVVAACSPRMHELTFQRLLKEQGLNPYLVEMVNIREHCTWVHALEPEEAQAKAWELILMGLAKVRLAQPLAERQVPVTRRALVVGGGPAGLKAALEMAQAGHEVVLAERRPVLGGLAARWHRTFPSGRHAATLLGPLMAGVSRHPRIRVLTDTEIVDFGGYVGNYHVRLRRHLPWVSAACDRCGACLEACPVTRPDDFQAGMAERRAIWLPSPALFPPVAVVDREACDRCGACVSACPQGAIELEAGVAEEELTVGAVVVATGAVPYDPAMEPGSPWPLAPQILTTAALERLLAPDGPSGGQVLPPGLAAEPREIAFVLCVGSREEEGFRSCSRICCSIALKQALELKKRLPQARIRIYYRDIRTPKPAGEVLYAAAREAGVIFLRGQVTEVVPEATGKVLIRAENEIFQRPTTDRVDLAVLAVGLRPGDGSDLRQILRLPVGPDGFFLEAHPKLRPLETVLDGVYLAGTCQGPKDLTETFTQATAAAGKVMALFAHEALTLPGLVAVVDPEACVGCGRCVQECPYQAIYLEGEGDEAVARVVTAACKGCGVCAGACPTGAAQVLGFTDDMLRAQIDAALAEAPERKILAFCCNWCAYAGADFAGTARLPYPANVRILRTLCAGRVGTRLLSYALRKGAGRVLVAGCHPPGDCHYLSGNLRAAARVARLQKKLAAKGEDPRRLRLAWISATEGQALQRLLTELAAELAPAAHPHAAGDGK